MIFVAVLLLFLRSILRAAPAVACCGKRSCFCEEERAQPAGVAAMMRAGAGRWDVGCRQGDMPQQFS